MKSSWDGFSFLTGGPFSEKTVRRNGEAVKTLGKGGDDAPPYERKVASICTMGPIRTIGPGGLGAKICRNSVGTASPWYAFVIWGAAIYEPCEKKSEGHT